MMKEWITMLDALRHQANRTVTENGAATLLTTRSDCLDLFSTVGALREASEDTIRERFRRAYAENPDLAVRILFYGRDVRGGLGERRVFRILLQDLAQQHPQSVQKNLERIAEMGRYDDLFALMDTPCQGDVVALVTRQLREDMEHAQRGEPISLLAKWMPSVNTSNAETVRLGRMMARQLGMSERAYRKMLSRLRAELRILENSLREMDYTFSYESQPSCAMFRYRNAFLRHDEQRYLAYMDQVSTGRAKLHTAALTPCDLVDRAINFHGTQEERKILDTTWNALEDFTDGRSALCVVDTSGSMFGFGHPRPFAVALSLGMYFAQRNRGMFRNHFITFSTHPRLIEIKGEDFVEQVQYGCSFCEVANTNIQAVFELILQSAVTHHLPQKEMPEMIYIISDMEFDICTRGASLTNFEYAKKLYAKHGYHLPQVVFWNVQSRQMQQPVDRNEQGTVLVSGYSPRLFQMVLSGQMDPYQAMLEVLSKDRYACICA